MIEALTTARACDGLDDSTKNALQELVESKKKSHATTPFEHPHHWASVVHYGVIGRMDDQPR